jgi:hypothetical protein
MFLNENSLLFTQIVNDLLANLFGGGDGEKGFNLSTPDYKGQPLKQEKLNG